jgi:hypothetical protein
MRRKVWQTLLALTLCVGGCRGKKHAPSANVRPEPSTSPAGPGGGGSGGSPVASHEGQHPPKPKARPDVVPPKLPSLGSQQQAHVKPPPRERRAAPLEDYPCGSVWTGEEEIPLECQAPIDDQHFGTPAVTLIPYNILRAPKGDLPLTVDHRTDGFEGRTLAQGKAGACTAFALTSQINHSIGLWTGTPGDISVMEVWARYHVANSTNSILANVGRTFAAETTWPYDQVRARAWMLCKGGSANCLNEDERRKLSEAEKTPIAVLEQIERLPSDDSLFDLMQAKLAAGRDIGTAGKLPKLFKPIGDAGSKYIPDFRGSEKGGHAFSLVGYTHVGSERYFLIKNSWGEKWGDGGYGWIHETSLRKIVHGGYVVVVDPVGDQKLRRHKRHPVAVAACAAGQVPDSVDNACKPTCSDGSARHGGYCGTTADCTKGFVNVAGECVLAAPHTKGTEPKTGITFACTAPGCTYNLPKGAGGCKDAMCQKSCPAPDYRLGEGKYGLLCLE